MSKAQSDAVIESRKLLGVGSEAFYQAPEESKHRFKTTLWAPSACGLCGSPAPILSSAQFLGSHDSSDWGRCTVNSVGGQSHGR